MRSRRAFAAAILGIIAVACGARTTLYAPEIGTSLGAGSTSSASSPRASEASGGVAARARAITT